MSDKTVNSVLEQIAQNMGSEYDGTAVRKQIDILEDIEKNTSSGGGGGGGKLVMPIVTLAELKTTHLAKDNFPGFAYVRGSGINDYVKSMEDKWVKGDGTVVSTDPGTVQPATNVRRIVTSGERYMNRPTRPGDLGGGAALKGVPTELVSRVPRRIARSAVKGLCLRVSNDYLWTTGIEGSANDLTIKSTYIEFPGVGTKQIKWDGSDGVVLKTKDFKHSVMIILPSDFGLTSFVPGTLFYVRGHAAVPADGYYPTVETWGYGDFQCAAFDPTVNACTNMGGTGELTFTNATRVGVYQPWTPVVTGLFEAGDPLVVGTWGDSLQAGAGDQGPEGKGRGYPERATMGDDWTQSYPGINMTRPGGYAFNWANHDSLKDMCKLFNFFVDGILTNNFDDQPNVIDSALNYTINLVKDSYVAVKGNALSGSGIRPMLIARMKLMPRTKTPTGTGVADQVLHGPKWGIGGNVEQFHNIIKVYNLVDYFYKPDPFSRASTDETNANSVYWKNGGDSAPDGTHAAYLVVGPTAADLRTSVLDVAAALPVAA